jgi:D-alanine-D-alanine ligase
MKIATTETKTSALSRVKKRPASTRRRSQNNKAKAVAKADAKPMVRSKLFIDKKALKKLRLVAVAYSQVEREWFPTEEAYKAELEVVERADEVVAEIEKMGIPAKGYPGDQYFFTNLIVDDPDLVVNLVDTLKGRDVLQTSIPAALELANIPYTGAGMRGLVIGNDRQLVKQLLAASGIPTPAFQFIQRRGTRVQEDLGLPLIVKLNESGGSVGIDNQAVRETVVEAQERVNELIGAYRIPVIVERFVDGPEITAVVFDDGRKRHSFLAQKVFRLKPDGKHEFTSLESYEDARSYTYKPVEDEKLAAKMRRLAERAFGALRYKDYAKFDIRLDEESRTAYFTDCNPNTAFGPSLGLPFTEVLALHGVTFAEVLTSLLSKHAKSIKKIR